MRKIIVVEHLTLDGVMQAPGHPDEDRSGGFEHGGWHNAYFDEDFMEVAGEGIGRTDAYLFGRRTYESMERFWADAPDGDPFGDTLNNSQKYVVSSTLPAQLSWRNSTLLNGPLGTAVKGLKASAGQDICVLGSGRLVRALLGEGLVDELLLTIDPLLLGTGARLFGAEHGRVELELISSVVTGSGVLVGTYRPVTH
jgi:dihydrofolate reductase